MIFFSCNLKKIIIFFQPFLFLCLFVNFWESGVHFYQFHCVQSTSTPILKSLVPWGHLVWGWFPLCYVFISFSILYIKIKVGSRRSLPTSQFRNPSFAQIHFYCSNTEMKFYFFCNYGHESKVPHNFFLASSMRALGPEVLG